MVFLANWLTVPTGLALKEGDKSVKCSNLWSVAECGTSTKAIDILFSEPTLRRRKSDTYQGNGRWNPKLHWPWRLLKPWNIPPSGTGVLKPFRRWTEITLQCRSYHHESPALFLKLFIRRDSVWMGVSVQPSIWLLDRSTHLGKAINKKLGTRILSQHFWPMAATFLKLVLLGSLPWVAQLVSICCLHHRLPSSTLFFPFFFLAAADKKLTAGQSMKIFHLITVALKWMFSITTLKC